MSSCETFNCILSPHERCIRGDNNKNNNINVRNIHVAIKKNLNVFVGDSLDNCSVSGDDSTKAIPECSSSKSSVSDHRLSKTEESQHEVPSSSSLGSYPDPNYSNPGQPDKNSSKNETMVASSLVQIWEARTTQQPSSSNQNQSQIDSRTSSSGSNVLENSESLNEESELIQPIEKGNNEEEKEEEMESDSQFVPDCGEKEREGVRVMDIIRKLSNDSETTANNDNGCDNGKEVQTTEAKSFPQVTCSPRIRGRQAFADLLVQMIRDREKELACLSDRHSVSKFTQRGRIQVYITALTLVNLGLNRTLSTLLRATVGKNLRNWLDCLPFVEFAYNYANHSATKLSPFEIVYGFKPETPLDLAPLSPLEFTNQDGESKAETIKKLHNKVKENIEKKTATYKKAADKGRKEIVFNPGD